MTTIKFIPQELQSKLIELGFYEQYASSFDQATHHGVTLEQAERWIWEEYRLCIEILIVPFFSPPYTSHIYKNSNYQYTIMQDIETSKKFTNPFSARLAGVEAVVEYLIKQKGEK